VSRIIPSVKTVAILDRIALFICQEIGANVAKALVPFSETHNRIGHPSVVRLRSGGGNSR
jgi:hypothetical protein